MPTEISLAKLLPAHSFFSHAGKTRMSISFFPAIETTIAVPGVMMHRESRSFTGFSQCVQEPLSRRRSARSFARTRRSCRGRSRDRPSPRSSHSPRRALREAERELSDLHASP